jgi:hypothetical protein
MWVYLRVSGSWRRKLAQRAGGVTHAACIPSDCGFWRRLPAPPPSSPDIVGRTNPQKRGGRGGLVGFRLSPAVFCICKAYEERKDKMEALQKEEVSSNLPQPHAHLVAVVIPARRGIASSSSPPQHSSVAPRLHLFDGRRRRPRAPPALGEEGEGGRRASSKIRLRAGSSGRSRTPARPASARGRRSRPPPARR